jgi:hypothetical protein
MTRLMTGAATAIAVVAALPPTLSWAQNYPWCLVISDKTGSMTCYFSTRDQCMMSTGGNVGFCMRNPAYPDAPPRRRPAR